MSRLKIDGTDGSGATANAVRASQPAIVGQGSGERDNVKCPAIEDGSQKVKHTDGMPRGLTLKWTVI